MINFSYPQSDDIIKAIIDSGLYKDEIHIDHTDSINAKNLIKVIFNDRINPLKSEGVGLLEILKNISYLYTYDYNNALEMYQKITNEKLFALILTALSDIGLIDFYRFTHEFLMSYRSMFESITIINKSHDAISRFNYLNSLFLYSAKKSESSSPINASIEWLYVKRIMFITDSIHEGYTYEN
ncbi:MULTISPECIES: hypothetical protein [Cysteiniphilum]|uniref:Uncharacterized protein n=1 Tax=Cysteiniphilum litorale TaxID=2056700 RepID=A0A8J2Z2Z3_9GAMM|nr:MULTISPECIES: hypothetical protein [Cysteiniphilum]GGF91496.1 hypothetical protein GCM10010995_05900 [Cysteiniphilum litorale]